MIGIYFSGTGNTKHCLELFARSVDPYTPCIPIEDKSVEENICQQDLIILAYPVYYSNLPKIVRDFIVNNRMVFAGKSVFVIATMGLFSQTSVELRRKNRRRITSENARLYWVGIVDAEKVDLSVE